MYVFFLLQFLLATESFYIRKITLRSRLLDIKDDPFEHAEEP